MSALDVIEARLLRLGQLETTYKEYAFQRFAEEDWHGLWDAAVNLSEVSCERDGLMRAYQAIENDKAVDNKPAVRSL